jgi:Rho GTPase-activating protein 1
MDALNLAIVICPNLVKGSNQARDVAMVCVPGTPAFFDRPSSNDGNGKNPQGERPATLGMVIALCIRRYYEVFDEIVDQGEAVPAWRALHGDNVPYLSVSGSPEQPMYVLSNEGEEEEDLDDDKLQKRVSPPTTSLASPTTRSMHTFIGETNGSIRIGDASYPTYKAKSTINIENGGASVNESGQMKGSITIGRGTTRKSSGAGVEAIGVTAGGFFSAPDDTPLVPDGKGGWKKS